MTSWKCFLWRHLSGYQLNLLLHFGHLFEDGSAFAKVRHPVAVHFRSLEEGKHKNDATPKKISVWKKLLNSLSSLFWISNLHREEFKVNKQYHFWTSVQSNLKLFERNLYCVTLAVECDNSISVCQNNGTFNEFFAIWLFI